MSRPRRSATDRLTLRPRRHYLAIKPDARIKELPELLGVLSGLMGVSHSVRNSEFGVSWGCQLQDNSEQHHDLVESAPVHRAL